MPTTVNDRELRGADFRVGISTQTEKDVIDNNPVFTPVRRTEGKTMKAIGYTTDPSVEVIGQAQEQIQDTEDLTMELQSVVSKQTIAWLIQAIHAETTNVSATSLDIASTATGFTSAGTDFADLQNGDGFWVSGFSNNAVNGFYIVADKVSSGEIETTIAPAAAVTAGDSVTIETNRSLNDDKPTYNVIQTRATDKTQADDINYHTIYNGVINTFTMEIGETGLLSATSNFLAEAEKRTTSGDVDERPISGQTYDSPLQDRAVTSRKGASAAVQGFYVDGESATCKIKSLTLEVNNEYQKDEAAGCEAYYTRGQFAASGSAVARSKVSAPFEWRNRSWNASRVSIGFRISHGAGDETYVVLNRNVVTEVTMADGNNVAANSELSFAAEKDPTRNRTIEVYTNWQS